MDDYNSPIYTLKLPSNYSPSHLANCQTIVKNSGLVFKGTNSHVHGK